MNSDEYQRAKQRRMAIVYGLTAVTWVLITWAWMLSVDSFAERLTALGVMLGILGFGLWMSTWDH